MTDLATWRRVALAATAVLALGAAACTPDPAPNPDPDPDPSAVAVFSNTTDLAAAGATVTITGTGFDPSLLTPPGTPTPIAVAGVYTAIGVGEGPVPTAYTSAKYIRPNGPEVETPSGAKLQDDGSFSATINAVPVFAAQGQAVNCYLDPCKIFVWSAHTGTVADWTFSTPVTFAPAEAPQIAVSKTSSLGAETVTVTGAGFAATSPGIYVGQVPWIAANAPSGWNLNAGEWGDTKFLPSATFGAGGTFRTTLDVATTIGASGNQCTAETPCSIATARAHGFADLTPSQITWTPLEFSVPAAS